MIPEHPRQRPGGRSARVVRAVTDATLEMMADKGFSHFSVGDVAAQARVNEATVYRRWGSRDNLIVETLLTHSRRTIPVPDSGSIRTDLTELTCAIADYLNTPVGTALSRALAANGDESRWAQVRFDFWSTRLETMKTIIERAVERHEVPPTPTPAWCWKPSSHLCNSAPWSPAKPSTINSAVNSSTSSSTALPPTAPPKGAPHE